MTGDIETPGEETNMPHVQCAAGDLVALAACFVLRTEVEWSVVSSPTGNIRVVVCTFMQHEVE